MYNRNDVVVVFLNKNLRAEKITKHEGYIELKIEGIDIVACYLSRNIRLQQFEARVDDITRSVRHLVLLGDFNAKSAEWCSPVTDVRGQYVAEWMSTLNLTALNKVGVSTFARRDSRSFIDRTTSLFPKISNWIVSDGETLSCHKHIMFDVNIASVGRLNLGYN